MYIIVMKHKKKNRLKDEFLGDEKGKGVDDKDFDVGFEGGRSSQLESSVGKYELENEKYQPKDADVEYMEGDLYAKTRATPSVEHESIAGIDNEQARSGSVTSYVQEDEEHVEREEREEDVEDREPSQHDISGILEDDIPDEEQEEECIINDLDTTTTATATATMQHILTSMARFPVTEQQRPPPPPPPSTNSTAFHNLHWASETAEGGEIFRPTRPSSLAISMTSSLEQDIQYQLEQIQSNLATEGNSIPLSASSFANINNMREHDEYLHNENEDDDHDNEGIDHDDGGFDPDLVPPPQYTRRNSTEKWEYQSSFGLGGRGALHQYHRLYEHHEHHHHEHHRQHFNDDGTEGAAGPSFPSSNVGHSPSSSSSSSSSSVSVGPLRVPGTDSSPHTTGDDPTSEQHVSNEEKKWEEAELPTEPPPAYDDG
jgi:hypothetical protein